jgi:hypothetical protein
MFGFLMGGTRIARPSRVWIRLEPVVARRRVAPHFQSHRELDLELVKLPGRL